MFPCYDPKNPCKHCTRAHNQWSRFEEDVDDVVPLAVRSTSLDSSTPITCLSGYSKEDLKEAQETDADLQKIKIWLTSGLEPDQKELALCSPGVKYLYLHKSQLKLESDLLYYIWKDDLSDCLLFIVPRKLKDMVMSLNHDLPLSGHMGIAKTLSRIKLSFIWYGIFKDVELFVKLCGVCNKNKKATVRPKAPLGQYHVGSPMERVNIDILGPFTPSAKGNQYVLMIVDHFTKWLECFPLPHQTAEEVAKCVVDGFISRLGCPVEIHTDQGKNLNGKLFASMCELLQIAKTRTTPYRPCSNGQVERYNCTLLQLVKCFLKGNQQHWDDHLQQLAGAIRSTVNRNTGFTPNLMMLGREVIQPVDLMMGNFSSECLTSSDYVIRLKNYLMQTHELARQQLSSAQMRQKKDDLRAKLHPYEVGDLVYRIESTKKIGQSPKLQQVWKGPLIVV